MYQNLFNLFNRHLFMYRIV